MARIITAQEFIDAAIVADKIANSDFTVQLSPAFEVNGEEFQVVVDGHHSLAAAIEAGVDAEFEIQTSRENDTIALLDDGNVEDFLETHIIDSEYHDAFTGVAIW